MTPQELVDTLESRKINPYISLAKLVLWVVSLVLVSIVLGCSVKALYGDAAQIGNIVGAAQALTVIALSVLGWHGYAGSQILYLARKLRGGDNGVLESVPTPKPPAPETTC